MFKMLFLNWSLVWHWVEFPTCEKGFHKPGNQELRGLYFLLNYTHIATYGLITFGENDFPQGKHIYFYNKRITESDIFTLGKAAAECLLTCLPVRKTAALLLKW